MSADAAQLYRVSVSSWVRERLLELADQAQAGGYGLAFAAALREFNRRLQVYPQFGDPLTDLSHEDGHIRLGVVPPLAMRYAVLESHRIVFVAARPVLLSKATRNDSSA